jgi:hypothetical protein
MLRAALGLCAAALGCSPPAELRAEPVAPDNANLQGISAGSVGCLPEEIQISHYKTVTGYAPETWLAQCRGHSFVCTYHYRATRCHELMAPGP